jgi:hypothetical protein
VLPAVDDIRRKSICSEAIKETIDMFRSTPERTIPRSRLGTGLRMIDEQD